MVANSHGFHSGINEFRVKVIKPGNDVIGITTDIDRSIKSKNQWFYDDKPDTCFTWYNGSQTIFDRVDRKSTNSKSVSTRWEENDIIRIVADCKSCTRSFYRNDELVNGHIKIKPDTTYYFMMCLNVKSSEYQILW